PMSVKDLLEKIQIENPCTADWDSMSGNDQVRFCEHCSLSVQDLSQMTAKRAMRLVVESRGRLCVRYHRPVIVPATLHRIGRRASQIAASAFTAALTVSSAVASQPTQSDSSGRHQTQLSEIAQSSLLETKSAYFGSISGAILDTAGAVVPGATITLGNESSNYLLGTTSDSEGRYTFEQLDPGVYRLTIERSGFSRGEIPQILLAENGLQHIDHTLQVAEINAEVEIGGNDTERGQFVTMGLMSMVSAAEPLVQAAQDDDLAAVEAALLNADVNLRDRNLGTTALEHAVRNGNREMVQVLLDAGADVNARNNSRETVIMMLGEEATSDIVWDLINAGAKVNLADEDGDTALMEAAAFHNLSVLRTLLEAGAKVDHRNKEGKTALMIAAGNGHLANVRSLIRAGADMNARDKEGKTVLDCAIENNQERVIKLLQSYGAVEGDVELGGGGNS
ncbi:MAG: ankyrin repeat domain-containing protein, partial [Acidobacteriota bacterium]